MSIDLAALKLRRMSPAPVRTGGRVSSPLSGATTVIDRLGARWSFRCETPAMPLEPDGRQWASILMEAVRLGARVPIVQPSLSVGPAGSPIPIDRHALALGDKLQMIEASVGNAILAPAMNGRERSFAELTYGSRAAHRVDQRVRKRQHALNLRYSQTNRKHEYAIIEIAIIAAAGTTSA